MDLLALAKKGNTQAQIELGDCYLNGSNGFAENDQEAFKWYKTAAESGHPLALGKLGEMYQYGYGTECSYEKAKVYYKKGADLNDATSQFRYAWLVEKEGDKALAYKYYTLAANQGHPNAGTYVMMLQMGM